jgi:drug/metabolite transporter (DMT)-like permease
MTKEKKGELSMFVSAFLWAFFPILTVVMYRKLPSIIVLGWDTVFCGIFFIGLIAFRNRWHEFRSWYFWKYAIGASLCIGVLFYGLYFIGLSKTTPGNATIIALSEVLTSFVFFSLYKKELLSKSHILGAILMLVGAFFVLVPGYSGAHIGDFFVLGATIIAPLGNYFQRKVRAVASSESLVFARCIISAPFIFILARVLGQHADAGAVYDMIPYLIIAGVVLFGLSKFLWIEAIHRISVTKASALSSLTPFLTLLFAWLILRQVPTVWQLASLVPFFLGTLLLTDNLRLRKGI